MPKRLSLLCYPLNCLEYYKFETSRFCEVEVGGECITEVGKTVTERLKVEIEGEELMTGQCVDSCGKSAVV